ncbi:MAG: TRAP transporter small permease subunit [Candidatus Azotimanducaceae bacterium]|tara:strand:- start:678 stop:1100 length:423 start_codon:yes stop_codon:yes gene_type:complete
MVIFTCGVVSARYIFNVGSIGMQELVMYLHGCVFMIGIAFTLKEGGHVRVDVLHEKLSEKNKAIIDIIGTLFFLMPFCFFIFFISLEYVRFAWTVQESSPDPGGLPGVFLLKTLIPIMAILVGFQGISETLKNFCRLRSL